MVSKVFFGSSQHGLPKASASFAAKVDKVVEMLDLGTINKYDKVAIKMHLGFNEGYQTIPVFFVRRIVKAIKNAGGWPFITDNPTAVYNAAERGYTSETCGCPLIPITGVKDGYKVKKSINFKNVEEIWMAGVLQDSDVLFDLSHVKGHNSCGFGGAIKNLGLGGFAAKSRWEKIHGVHQSIPYWDGRKANPEHAKKLVKSCLYEALKYNEEKHELKLDFDSCFNTNCRECLKVDENVGSLSFRQEHFSAFSELQAIAASKVIESFDKKKRFFVNFLIEITSYCDCWGFGQPAIVNDIGVLASRDPVAIETASLDLVAREGLIDKNVPPFFRHANFKREEKLHPFQRIHGGMKNPFMAVDALQQIFRNEYSKEYELVEVLAPKEVIEKGAPKVVKEKDPSFF